MTPRTLLSVVALLVILVAGGFAVLRLLDDPDFWSPEVQAQSEAARGKSYAGKKTILWPPDDYVEYWAAGRLNLHGLNPYSAELLLPLERQAGRDTDEAVMMWNPPWTLTVAMPLGALPARVGQLLWLVLNLAAIGLSAWLLWQTYDGRRDKAWVAFAVALTFMPSLFVLHAGQISALLLLGCALFVWCVRRGYHFAAGAAACLVAIKPHLAYLLWFAVGLDAVLNRRWRIVLGGVVTGVVASAIPMAFNPDVWGQYVEAYRSSPVPPSKWVSLTPGVVLRLIFGEERFWLQFVPMVAGVAWFAWQWRRHGVRWDWAEQLPALVLVSFVTAPYGAWHFDLVLLLLPILHRATLMVNRRCEPPGSEAHPAAHTAGSLAWAVPLLVLANVAMFAMTRLGVYSYWFAWVAPLVLIVYAATAARRPSPQLVPA